LDKLYSLATFSDELSPHCKDFIKALYFEFRGIGIPKQRETILIGGNKVGRIGQKESIFVGAIPSCRSS